MNDGIITVAGFDGVHDGLPVGVGSVGETLEESGGKPRTVVVVSVLVEKTDLTGDVVGVGGDVPMKLGKGGIVDGGTGSLDAPQGSRLRLRDDVPQCCGSITTNVRTITVEDVKCFVRDGVVEPKHEFGGGRYDGVGLGDVFINLGSCVEGGP